MGINISIGEACISCTAGGCHVSTELKVSEHGSKNTMRTTYTHWEDFVVHAGLEALFPLNYDYDEDYFKNYGHCLKTSYPLIVSEQGAMPITAEHLEYLRTRIDDISDPQFEGLSLWLWYWLNVALTECKQPVFVVS